MERYATLLSLIFTLSSFGPTIRLAGAEDDNWVRLANICCEFYLDCCYNYLYDDPYANELVATQWLDVVNDKMVAMSRLASVASWNYETNMTEATSDKLNKVTTKLFHQGQLIRDEAEKFEYDSFSYDTRRQFTLLLEGSVQLNVKKDDRKLKDLQGNMLDIYSTGKVCDATMATGKPTSGSNDCKELEPDLVDIMAKSRDYNELLKAWKGWRDAVGIPIGKLYPEYVRLLNEGAREKGYKDMAEESLEISYELEDFDKLAEQLFDEIRPLYIEIHAYVRHKLSLFYGPEQVSPDGLIPAHILGNMWAQQWTPIYDIVEPFPDKPSVDVTDEMIRQNYTPMRMFKMADEFFESLGFEPMPTSFWEKSVFVKPTDREVACHPSAEDFFTEKDVRIKMCSEVNMYDFYTIHHEMGHCQYYINYRDQPIIYRGGANPAFHEAVGDTIALSVNTPRHLHSVGLLKVDDRTQEEDVNFLMRQALERVVLLPYALALDQWRWNVYRGDIEPKQYNSHWWDLRARYQGLTAPIERGEHDFDPGAKYHVASGIPYIRYFVSFLMQFQFHKSLCKEAGFSGPIHRCDIYNSKEAGEKLRQMMELGRSRPWPDVMQVITGQRRIQTEAILEYFQPLMEWLQEQNNDRVKGW